jgi:hypothetical protein
MGFGDNIMFSRFLKMLVDHGIHVILSVPPQLGPLMACLPYIQVHGEHSPEPDMWVSMMSLARIFETNIGTVPAPTDFGLDGQPHANIWGGRVMLNSASGRLKVGLCWSGSRKSQYDEHRSIPFEALKPLFDIHGVDFYSLQLDVRESDRKAYDEMPVYGMADRFFNFLDTACAIRWMDMVITVDTSVCHLAGSLGVPTLVMLTSFRTYWMWIVGRTDSPWYPEMTAYRQETDGEWGPVVEKIVTDMRALMLEHSVAINDKIADPDAKVG